MVNIPLIVKGSKVRRDFGIQDISLGMKRMSEDLKHDFERKALTYPAVDRDGNYGAIDQVILTVYLP